MTVDKTSTAKDMANLRKELYMTDSKMLRDKISECGYKLRFVADKCGLSYAGFMKKVDNETEFKASEIETLKNLLHLTEKERTAIFFYKESR